MIPAENCDCLSNRSSHFLIFKLCNPLTKCFRHSLCWIMQHGTKTRAHTIKEPSRRRECCAHAQHAAEDVRMSTIAWTSHVTLRDVWTLHKWSEPFIKFTIFFPIACVLIAVRTDVYMLQIAYEPAFKPISYLAPEPESHRNVHCLPFPDWLSHACKCKRTQEWNSVYGYRNFNEWSRGHFRLTVYRDQTRQSRTYRMWRDAMKKKQYQFEK